MLQELLKKYLGEDAKVTEFLNEMKEQKIYLSKEENIDTRYQKLKGDYDALNTKNTEAETLIAELKKANGGNEELQGKITQYEEKIAEQEAQLKQLQAENAVKFELLAKGAKASDMDYLLFKAKQLGELKLDKEGNVKGLNDLVENLKKTCQSNFEESSKKKFDVKKLPNDDEKKDVITKERFDKMGYQEKNKLYQENKELYEQLRNGKED